MINFSYNMSDQVHVINVYEKDCQTPLAPNTIVYITDESVTKDEVFKIVDVTVSLNMTDVESCDIYTSSDDGGYVEFCVKSKLTTSSSLIVNFHESIVNITVDLMAGIGNFNLDANLSRTKASNIEEDMNFSRFIYAYQCDDNRDKVEENAATLTQGDILSICATSNNELIKIDQVSELVIKQGTENQFNAIEKGEATNKALSTNGNTCNEGICMVRVLMLAMFFDTDAPSEIDIAGSVKLSVVGSSAGRYLQKSMEGYAEVEETIGTFDFHLNLNKPQEIISSAFKHQVMLGMAFCGTFVSMMV